MNSLRRKLSFILMLLSFLPLRGQPYTLRNIEVEDGLSQNMVYCVLQDRSDFIWIGTQNGLNRYDGNSFRIFKKDSSTGLSNDGICSLAEDASGRLWVGTVLGLHIYNPVEESFRYIPIRDSYGQPVEGLVRDIEFSPDGEAFVVVADTCLVRIGSDMTSRQIDLGEKGRGIRIRDINLDREGNIWIASYVGGLMQVSGSTGQVRDYPFLGRSDRMFTKVVTLDNETLLVGTMDYGVLSFNLRSKTFSVVKQLDRSSVRFVHDIMIDSGGRIWAGAENGVHIAGPSGVTHLSHGDASGSLSDNAVFCITEDRDGGVWIGTYFGGVNYYSKDLSLFHKYYPVPEPGSLKGKNISEFCQAPDGSIWIGTEDAGLHRFHPSDGKFESGFLPAGNIHALALINGKLWAGSYGEGLFVMDADGRSFSRYHLSENGGAPGDDNIFSIVQDISGKIWIGAESGLFSYDEAAGSFTKEAAGLISRQVNDILQDFEGNIWFATLGQGLFRLDTASGIWSSTAGVGLYLTCILEDSDHNLWFGTEDGGICFRDHRSKTVERRWTEADGLPNNMIYKLLQDDSGGIWGSTNHGLFLITPYRDRVMRFDHRSGLIGDQFNFKSGLKADDGRFYFGGVKGFVGFDPSSFNFPARRSKIVFNRFLLFNSDVKPGAKGSPLEKSIIFTDEITLKPGQTMFSIGFADLDYSSSDIKTYQYRLVGQDREWINIERNHLLSFSKLPPGHYRLEVRANPLNSFPGDAVKSLDIRILPPWYMTYWAYSIAGILVLSLLLLLLRAVMRKARERGREAMRREIESLRAASVADLKFLDKVKAIMQDNLANPDLSVNMLADMLHMSRSTFYRRMKGITELSGNDFIRQYRLERAASLLSEKTYPVADVASMTGFSSVSYFSRSFRSRYGVSPKDYKGDKS